MKPYYLPYAFGVGANLRLLYRIYWVLRLGAQGLQDVVFRGLGFRTAPHTITAYNRATIKGLIYSYCEY